MGYDTFFAGTNILVVREGKLLLGKRKNKDGNGDGTWGLPGGHLEINENMQHAAARELLEETGLVSDSFVFANVVNNPEGEKHYIQIGFSAQNTKGEPKLMEPDKCEGWQWFDLNELPAAHSAD